MTRREPFAVRTAIALFALCARALPVRFRHDFGPDVREAFADEARAAHRAGGSPALAAVTARALADVLRSALDVPWRLRRHRIQHREPTPKGVRMHAVWQDLRYGTRSFARQPGFTLVALVMLTVGIAANSAIFTLVNAALIRPLPYPDAHRLVRIWGERPSAESFRANVNPLDALDWRREAAALDALGVWSSTTTTLTGAGDPIALPVAFVTSEFFGALGTAPAMGRLFDAGHDTPGRETEIVVSDRFWRATLGADPGVLGRTLRLGDVACTIIGVLPPAFVSPGTSSAIEPAVWRPFVITSDMSRGGHFARTIARLKPGATVADAQAQIDAIMQRLEREYTSTNLDQRGRVEPLQQAISGDAKPALVMLMAAVGLVLLIACANVANLLLARGATRQREIALRGALGASRRRIVRQLLTESLLLGSLAAVLGSALGVAAVEMLPRWLADQIPTVMAARVDMRVLAFACALSIGTALLFGLVPALLATRHDLRSVMAEGSPAVAGPRRLQSALLVAEAALALVLLVGATLLVESLIRLQRVDPGFNTEQVLTFRISLPRIRYPEAPQSTAFFTRALERISALPGVTAAGGVNMSPLTDRYSCDSFGLADRPAPPEGTEPCAESRVTTRGYFEAMGIPLVNGRLFGPQDTRESQQVIVISETMAKKYWPAGNAIGQRFKWGSVASRQPWLTVIGVVGDVRHYGLAEDAAPEVHTPIEQNRATTLTIAVRGARDPATLAGEVRGVIASLDPALAISEMFTTGELMARATAVPAFRTQLLGAFALIALGLAVAGVYGVLSFYVVQRRREIGIRLALGATPRGVRTYIIRRGLAAAAAGTVLGLIAAVPLTRAMRDLLFDVTPADPLAFIIAPVLLLATALVACYVPARRATRLDPVATIKD